MTPLLYEAIDGMSARQLYDLSFEISERLVQLERERLYEEATYASVTTSFDCQEDNHGCW